VNYKSRVLVQGITGKEGSFHTQQMIEYGTKVVAGVTPKKGGTKFNDIPIFNTVDKAIMETGANVSIIFVPASNAADAIVEAASAGIELIICITERIPVQDMIKVKAFLKNTSTRLIGPNCPGVITPGEAKVGIMPGFIHKKGNIGIASRSGTLSYEVVYQLTRLGLGQSSMVGIGGDPILGSSMKEIVELFMNDDDTDTIVIIGEIGGGTENEVADYVKDNKVKPVFAFISGVTAPKGRTMGHAGAIIGGKDDTAQAKKDYLRSCGINIIDSPADIGRTVFNFIKNK
jgi:succinyl-CoA synthetase alpha subunit